ncbi:MAG: DUF1272 domain-containing protein [Gemmatimonadetes bacterium]|nr:MAG: DUF1272 domain-containing protein [Gemmatimonadota bacterium]
MALEMRTSCETCGTGLASAGPAFISAYDCTRCERCRTAMAFVCANCHYFDAIKKGAGDPLPTRPNKRLKLAARVD